MRRKISTQTSGSITRRPSSRLATTPSTCTPEPSKKRKRGHSSSTQHTQTSLRLSRSKRPEHHLPQPKTTTNKSIQKSKPQRQIQKQRLCPKSLLDLPQEVRLMIYQYVFPSTELVLMLEVPSSYERPPKIYRRPCQLGLLYVSRQIYIEAQPVFAQAQGRVTLTLDSWLNATCRRKRFWQWPWIVVRDYNWASTLPDGSALVNVLPVIAEPTSTPMVERVNRLNLPFPDSAGAVWKVCTNLRVVGLMDQVCHFQEVDRPDDEDAVRAMIVDSVKHHLPRLLEKQRMWPFIEESSSSVNEWMQERESFPWKIDPVATVWFLNTQKKSGEGWTLEIDSTTSDVRNVQKAWFEKVPFDGRLCREDDRSTQDMMTVLQRAWKLSTKGWKMTRLTVTKQRI